MARHSGAFKSDKRRKELQRQKKQEEKRQKRFKKDTEQQQDSEMTPSEGADTETTEIKG